MSAHRSPVFDDEMDRDIEQKQRDSDANQPSDQLSQILHRHSPCVVEAANLTVSGAGLYFANWKPAGQAVGAVSDEIASQRERALT